MSNNPRPRSHADNNPHWDARRAAQAQRQGWDVFDCGDGLEIQRIDCPEDGNTPFFESDAAAQIAVKEAAEGGNALARAAIDEVAMYPRGTVKPNRPGWKRLPPTAAGWYFVDSLNGGVFPVELVERDTTARRGDDGLLVRGAYIGHGSRDMRQFLGMFGHTWWFGPIELPPASE